MIYRKAKLEDLTDICRFVDWWISGRGKAKGIVGAVNDCFISRERHIKYIVRYDTWLCLHREKLVAWAVVEPSGVLIHLLVAGDKRGLGIGAYIMCLLNPKCVRSKLDQATGDPVEFYKKLGYSKVDTVTSKGRLGYDEKNPGRRRNIDVLVK